MSYGSLPPIPERTPIVEADRREALRLLNNTNQILVLAVLVALLLGYIMARSPRNSWVGWGIIGIGAACGLTIHRNHQTARLIMTSAERSIDDLRSKED